MDVVHVCTRAGHYRATPHCGQCSVGTTPYCIDCGAHVEDGSHRCT